MIPWSFFRLFCGNDGYSAGASSLLEAPVLFLKTKIRQTVFLFLDEPKNR